MSNILEVKNLSMHYETIDGDVDAVKNVSFNVKAGESFGIVGESGCGKTSVAMSLLQLQAENGKISENYDEKKLREYMQWDSIEIEVNLKLGNDAFKCYTCDFTHDYIDINADYRN